MRRPLPAGSIGAMRKLMPLFTPTRSPELRATPRRVEPLNMARAGLEGLEVSDSSWDEWVSAELAEREQRAHLLRAGRGSVQQ